MNENLNSDTAYEGNMFYGASPALFQLADELRNKMTDAEEILWNALKINEWHLKFRRQHPISNYIAHFYCHKLKLVIELDGGYHEQKEVKIYDNKRENDIKEFGIRVLRFQNEELLNNFDMVLNTIGEEIKLAEAAIQVSAEFSKYPPLGEGGNDPKQANNRSLIGKDLPPLFIIKIGGNVLDEPSALQSFLSNFASIKAKKILVHGGGKIATKIGEQLGIKSNYINGRRITDEATIDLVTMVYGGLVNKKIVAKLQSLECNAIGLTGADANIIPATKRPIVKTITATAGAQNTPSLGDVGIDYGFVGDIKIEAINTENLKLLLDNNFTLIIAPLTHDGNGQMLNTNADTIASSLAIALSKSHQVRLIYCFEKKGVLENVEDENSVVNLITKEKYQQLLIDKKLFDGILPKIDNAFAAIESGVSEVLIGHANDLLQNTTNQTKGTLIK